MTLRLAIHAAGTVEVEADMVGVDTGTTAEDRGPRGEERDTADGDRRRRGYDGRASVSGEGDDIGNHPASCPDAWARQVVHEGPAS